MTVALRDLDSGDEREVRARYVVAADGNRSPMRGRLGIGMRGYGQLSRSITIYFRADCAELLRDRNQGVIYVHNPRAARVLPARPHRGQRLPRHQHGR